MNKLLQWPSARQWVLIAGLAALLLPVTIIIYNVLHVTQGIWAYPLDDSFIHLAVAKSLAFHGVWGIDGQTFSSASSSPLYTLLLATGLKTAGNHFLLPFIINITAALAFVILLQQWLRKQNISLTRQVIVLLVTVMLIPLPVLVLFGMEHTLQLLFCFLFVYRFGEAMEKMTRQAPGKEALPWQVYLYGLLLCSTRYEGVFLVMTAALLLLLRRRWLVAIQLGLVSTLPILVFGFYSLWQGGYFIPNSVLLKSNAPPPTVGNLLYFVIEELPNRLYLGHGSMGGAAVQGLLILLPLASWLFATPLKQAAQYRYILLVLTGGLLLHLLLATTVLHPIRYEAYLVGCSLPVLGVLAARYGAGLLMAHGRSQRGVFILLLLLLLFPLLPRAKKGFDIIQQACINIYEQQYQMGRFLQKYYCHEHAASGDIGAIAYFTAGNILDLEGLANNEVLRSRRSGYWGPRFLDWMCRKDSVKLAIVFDRSYSPLLRNQWKKVASWQIPNNVICYSDIVSFYAVDSTLAPGLKANLQAYQSVLPREVMVKYY